VRLANEKTAYSNTQPGKTAAALPVQPGCVEHKSPSVVAARRQTRTAGARGAGRLRFGLANGAGLGEGEELVLGRWQVG
jgi:hypothetical protein